MAERAVQTAKTILRQKDPDIALLNYRNTKQSAIGVSPAEALMGRMLRSRVPVLDKVLKPSIKSRDVLAAADRKAKENNKRFYDARHGVRDLSPLRPGQSVLVKTDDQQGWKRPGTVVATDQENRSYLINTQQGLLRRNRKHIQATPLPLADDPPELPVPVAEPVSPATATQQQPLASANPPVRRTTRRTKPPRRLIEDS